jgi:hypothetical protein
MGSAWAILLYQRGFLAVHASAVRAGEGAVLFCAGRGNGKSTLAAALAKNGFALICDDLCRVDPTGEAAIVYPSAPRLKLWSDVSDMAGFSRSDAENEIRPGKFTYPCGLRSGPEPVPVQAIVLPSWGSLRIERITGFEALHRFISSATWRGKLVFSCGNSAGYFQGCADLLKLVPVYEFRRPRDLNLLNSSLELLMAYIGLPENRGI